jgi:hypothetical protein
MKALKTMLRLFLVGFFLMSSIPPVSEGSVSALEGIGFAPAGPGLHVTTLYAGQTIDAGTASVWNSREKLQIQVEALEGWRISEIQIYVGTDPVPTKKGNPVPGKFPYKKEYADPSHQHTLVLDLEEDLAFSWGIPWEDQRIQNVAVHADLVQLDEKGKIIAEEGAWAFGPAEFEGDQWGWWFSYEIAHPRRGHFIDSPVGGLSFGTPTHAGKTDESGGFDYFPGERVELAVGSVHLGTPLAGHKVSPLDIFEEADIDDPRVINMARLLQSLDADASPKDGISITGDVEACLDDAVQDLGLTGVDFSADDQVESVIQGTINHCEGVEGVTLAAVSAEDAKANLDRSLNTAMFRKDVSRTPDLTSSKSKLNIMGMWFPALRANNDPAYYVISTTTGITETGIPYYDESGNLIRAAQEAKPIVVVYTDGVEETGAEDIFAAISRDDGNTFKRKNLSRAADRSSFTLANGEEYFGQTKKPVFQVKGNNILVAWTSKFCKGGRPAYAITTCDDPETEEVEADDPLTEENECAVYCRGNAENEVCEPDYPYDDAYYVEDIWGVGGPQRSVDYTDQDFPEVGEVPYSCVWTARGTIVTQGMINSGGFWANYEVGEIVWFKPERLTSGRRDANQVFMGGAPGAGFAIAWQEDPKGLRPGSAAGPGPGWGGATTNHKTDIWYSYITMADFRQVDMNFLPGGDPQHDDPDLIGRPKALVPMSLPVRLSDNDVVNTDNLLVELDENGYPVVGSDGNWTPISNPETEGDGTGTHAYGYEIDGLCEGFYEFTNYQDEQKRVCITADNRLLDGDTGASRPNVFLQPYTKPDGTKSAWAIMAYEETKGAGVGPPDHTEDPPYGDTPLPEVGKNAIYHSFDFQNPDLVSAGNIINLPERDADGNLMYLREVSLDDDGNVVFGELILDYLGQPQLAYENARRPRFIIQGKAAMGDSSTVMVVLYKEGQEGQGRQSDIMLRRFVSDTPGNPYRFENIVCNAWEVADNGLTVCVDGTQNMSTVTPTETWINPDSDPDAHGDGVKVIRWKQTVDNLADPSWLNPYEEARAHRGAIRGDFVVMGYSYTPNWAAARNGHDKYDFYVRRSFDGGQTWTTDPTGSGVTHCYTFKDPVTKIREEVCTFYSAGEFEMARNLSQLRNNKESVIEPRIVGAPGTIKDPATSQWTGIAEDKQNKNVFYVSYGTSTNPPQVHGNSDEEEEFPAPLDLYYSFSMDKGESYEEVQWVVNPDSAGNNAGETVTGWDWLAKGDPEQGEAQLRMTPDGSRFYATWLQEGEEGSDIWFRRITPSAFPVNNLQ